jgi:hypothetical protein
MNADMSPGINTPPPVDIPAPEGWRLTLRNNGKAVPAPRRPLTDPKMADDYTFGATEKARDRRPGKYGKPTPEAPYGYYMGRPIIGRDSPEINGGVYFTDNDQSEVIVVDDDRHPGSEGVFELRQLYSKIQTDLESRTRINVPEKAEQDYQDILKAVYQNVQRLLPYDMDRTKAIIGANVDTKINLYAFIKGGAGVCRHQALLAAYILERLSNPYAPLLPGKVSVDRNHNLETRDGHAWARFTAPNGEVYIIDPAQNYVGKLRDAEGEIKAGRVWDYRVAHGK